MESYLSAVVVHALSRVRLQYARLPCPSQSLSLGYCSCLSRVLFCFKPVIDRCSSWMLGSPWNNFRWFEDQNSFSKMIWRYRLPFIMMTFSLVVQRYWWGKSCCIYFLLLEKMPEKPWLLKLGILIHIFSKWMKWASQPAVVVDTIWSFPVKIRKLWKTWLNHHELDSISAHIPGFFFFFMLQQSTTDLMT